VNSFFRFCAALTMTLALSVRAETSDLWGANGERWDPHGRLPDFSHAGYHEGEVSPPRVPPGISVKTFGAKGDGKTDDTRAFLAALATVTNGAIEVPAGRYVITDILEIKRSHVVLRGAGPGNTVLFFPKPLQEIRPVQSSTTEGRPTSEYSWAGGFVWFRGDLRTRSLTTIVGEARRGDRIVQVQDASLLKVGHRVEVFQTDTSSNTLAVALYSGNPGDVSNLHGTTHASLVCRIVEITGAKVVLDRPLRFDIKAEWMPRLRDFEMPTVVESGVEDLGFEFPNTPYQGHFTEPGFNAAAFSDVVDCWARNLRIVNPDSGIFCRAHFCTIQGVVFESARTADRTGSTGHHGFDFEGEDCLFTDFDFRMQFIHDLTLDHCAAGNVLAHGKGIDLCFDHHKRACYENLFVDIDAGQGTHLWRCGGGAALGKNCAARGTFWNIRTARPQRYPPENFGPPSLNLIGVQTVQPSEKNETNRWFEAISPDKLEPRDIHAAQLERRLKSKGR
jgi:hypothetical protein